MKQERKKKKQSDIYSLHKKRSSGELKFAFKLILFQKFFWFQFFFRFSHIYWYLSVGDLFCALLTLLSLHTLFATFWTITVPQFSLTCPVNSVDSSSKGHKAQKSRPISGRRIAQVRPGDSCLVSNMPVSSSCQQMSKHKLIAYPIGQQFKKNENILVPFQAYRLQVLTTYDRIKHSQVTKYRRN